MAVKRRRRAGRSQTITDPLETALAGSNGAERVRLFFERCLHHSSGEWAGRPFVLEDWQWREIVEPLFGTLRADGRRQYRHGLISLPRKAGKTTLCAGLANYMTFADREKGAQVYLAAASRDQAGLCFAEAANQVKSSPILRDRATVSRAKKLIHDHVTGSYLKVISSEAFTAHGLNTHCFIVDEIAQQPNRELVDVLATSMGARRSPLGLYVGTAGWNRQSIAYELYELAKRIEDGTAVDPTFFHMIREAAKEDDPFDEAVWHRVNPSLGTFRSREEFRETAERAKLTPSFLNSFKNLYLNMWTSTEVQWLDRNKWDACGGRVDDNDLKGRRCYGGLDLSTTTDLSAFALAFPDDDEGVTVRVWFWIPEQAIEDRGRRDRVPYREWVEAGLIEATPGNVIDYGFIRARVNDLADKYDIREIGFDPWNSTGLVTELTGDGHEMFPVRQGFVTLSPPTKECERLVTAGLLRHGGNPVLSWCADNAMAVRDAAGNLKIDKSKSRDRIDGLAATINALERLSRHQRRAATPKIYVL